MPAAIQVIDLTPKFLKFYEAAQGANPDRRWELWNEHYQFAAVPPTPEGTACARQMLDQSWHRYPEALETIRAGAAGYYPHPQTILDQVCRVLAFDGDMTVRCVLFVGNFEENAFAFSVDGVSIINCPVEGDPGLRAMVLAHEFAHAVHQRLGGYTEDYVKPIGALAMMEGIALWTAREVAPGGPDSFYLSFPDPGWVDRCQAVHADILTGIRPHLTEKSPEAMWRFTMGTGTTGLEREVYWAGWHAVKYLVEQGHTLASLARVPEQEAVALIDSSLAALAGNSSR